MKLQNATYLPISVYYRSLGYPLIQESLGFVCNRTCLLLKDAIKILLCILLSVKPMDPIFSGKANAGRVLLDLGPVCLVPQVARRLASLLDGPHTIVSASSCQLRFQCFVQQAGIVSPQALVCSQSTGDISLACTLQADCNRHSILHRLSCALSTRWQEWVSCVAKKSNAALLADPSRQGIPIDQLPIHNRGRLLDNGSASRVPVLQHLQHLFNLARE